MPLPKYKPPKKAGRNTVVTDEVINNLCSALKGGASIEGACLHAHIHKATFYRKLKKDPNFATKIGFAINYLTSAATEVIHDEIVYKKNPKVAMWLLERTIPERYTKKILTLQIKKTIKLGNSAKKKKQIQLQNTFKMTATQKT